MSGGRRIRSALACVALAGCRAPSLATSASLKPLPLTDAERQLVGCYRLHGITRADSADTGFAADSVLRLDSAVIELRTPSRGPARALVNEHPFTPRPQNFETAWWRDLDGALHLEWRTPPRSSKAYIYSGGEIELRAAGDSLVGSTMTYSDVRGPTDRSHTVALIRLSQCARERE